MNEALPETSTHEHQARNRRVISKHKAQIRFGCAVLSVASLSVMAAEIPAGAANPSLDKAHRYGRGLRAVDGVSPDNVWAVGYPKTNGTLIEHWDGQGWTRVDNPQTPHQAGFFAVDARTAKDAWAVGFNTPDGNGLWAAYAQRWDGHQWREVDADPGLATSQANAVSARTGKDAWIVGEATKTPGGALVPLIERWNGSGWQAMPGAPISPKCEAGLASVTAVSASDVWAAGTQNCARSKALLEHWDGSQWTKTPSPAPKGAYVAINGVTAISSDDVWAIGSTYHLQQPSKTFVLHWDGERWTRVSSPNPGAGCSQTLESVGGSQTDDVWAVGSRSCNQDVLPVALHWNGEKWTSVKAPATGFRSPAGDSLFGVTSLSNDAAVAVGIAKTNGRALEAGFIERWNGSRWTLQ